MNFSHEVFLILSLFLWLLTSDLEVIKRESNDTTREDVEFVCGRISCCGGHFIRIRFKDDFERTNCGWNLEEKYIYAACSFDIRGASQRVYRNL